MLRQKTLVNCTSCPLLVVFILVRQQKVYASFEDGYVKDLLMDEIFIRKPFLPNLKYYEPN